MRLPNQKTTQEQVVIELVEVTDNTRIQNSALRERTLFGSRGGSAKHYVAHDGVAEVAFLALDPRPHLGVMVVYEIFVPAELRHRGIGTDVLLAAEAVARRSGFRAVRLVPQALGLPHGEERDRQNARLIRWYQRCGYKATADSNFTEWQKEL